MGHQRGRDEQHDTGRRVLPAMRVVLLLGSILVTLAGIQLFLLTRRTDHYFAWTIGLPLTAAFIGAFYWTSTPIALLSAVERSWVRARVAIPGVTVFLWATLATTLLHLGKFHLHSADRFARGAAWLWLIVYAAYPAVVTVVLLIQIRSPGADPPRTAPLAPAYRAAIGAQALVALAVGAALFAAPGWADRWWPWPLTPLTARAMASWLLGLGFVLAGAFHENDWIRIRVATISYSVLGVLQLVALVLYRDDLRGGAATGIYAAFAATVLPVGVYGWARAERSRRVELPRPVSA